MTTKTIDYEELGNIVLYTGNPSSGLTLASVIHTVELQKLQPVKKIVTNINLFSIDSLGLNKDTLLEESTWTNSIVLVDVANYFIGRNRQQTKVNKLVSYFILKSRVRNCTLVLNSPDPQLVDLRIRRLLTNIILTQFDKENNLLRLSERIEHVGEEVDERRTETIFYNPIKVEDYFKYYSAADIVKLFKE